MPVNPGRDTDISNRKAHTSAGSGHQPTTGIFRQAGKCLHFFQGVNHTTKHEDSLENEALLKLLVSKHPCMHEHLQVKVLLDAADLRCMQSGEVLARNRLGIHPHEILGNTQSRCFEATAQQAVTLCLRIKCSGAEQTNPPKINGNKVKALLKQFTRDRGGETPKFL